MKLATKKLVSIIKNLNISIKNKFSVLHTKIKMKLILIIIFQEMKIILSRSIHHRTIALNQLLFKMQT